MTRSANPRERAAFENGTLVRYTAAFLRSTGLLASNRIDGVVVGSPSAGYNYVVWNDRDMPVAVGSSNIEKKASKQTAQSLINASKIASGLPIGDDQGMYLVFAKDDDKAPWRYMTAFGDRKSAENAAMKIYDDDDKHIAVLDPAGYVILAQQVYRTKGSRRSNTGKSKRGGSRRRKSNGAGLGAFIGSMVGAIVGAVSGIPVIGYIGSVVGGAIGGEVAAPERSRRRGAMGGGLGAIVFGPIGAAVGGYFGGRKPDGDLARYGFRKTNPVPKVGDRIEITAARASGAQGTVRDLVTVHGRHGVHVDLDVPIEGQTHALVGVGDVRLSNPRHVKVHSRHDDWKKARDAARRDAARLGVNVYVDIAADPNEPAWVVFSEGGSGDPAVSSVIRGSTSTFGGTGAPAHAVRNNPTQRLASRLARGACR